MPTVSRVFPVTSICAVRSRGRFSQDGPLRRVWDTPRAAVTGIVISRGSTSPSTTTVLVASAGKRPSSLTEPA
jgi:hypothetical protein